MRLRTTAGRVIGLAVPLGVVLGILVAGAGATPALAVTCPTVNPTTHKVTPAPSPGVIWTGCILTGADMHGADLAGARLTDANLNQVNLNGADLDGTFLDDTTNIGLISGGVTGTPAALPTSTVLLGGYLVGPKVSLAKANLGGIDLSGADLIGVSSGGVTGTPTALPANWSLISGYLVGPGANLAGANLAGANLSGADLNIASDNTVTNLTGANLTGANLTNADFTSANLTNANLANTTLTGAILDANLSGVSSGGVTGTPAFLPSGWQIYNTYLVGDLANLTGANLASIDLANADVTLVLTNANLTDANFSGANLTSSAFAGADLAGTNLSGAVLQFATSGGITGTPTALPTNWSLKGGYLIGPFSFLQNAALAKVNLSGVDLFMATVTGANLSGANLTGATLGDVNFSGANLSGATIGSDSLAGANLMTANFSNAGLAGADLASAKANNANFTKANLAGDDLENIVFASATLTGTSLNNADLSDANLGFSTMGGANLTGANLTGANAFDATFSGTIWSNTTCPDGSNSDKYVDGCFSSLDTTPPVVTVTGVRTGGGYPLGAVPAPGCRTTDNGKVAVAAKLSVVAEGSHGLGLFNAACTGAVDLAGNVQTAPVEASYNVLYGFGGYLAPVAGSTVAKKDHTITVRFRLNGASGHPVSASIASSLASAHDVQVSLTGPGISKPVVAACSWNKSARAFSCTVKIPAAVTTGHAKNYLITAAENLGDGFLPAPKAGDGSNPETIHFS